MVKTMSNKVKRYKPIRFMYKLNMLEPGTRMCKFILFCFAIGLISYFMKCEWLILLACSLGGMSLLILFILIIIEQYQDKVLYEEAKKEDPDIE